MKLNRKSNKGFTIIEVMVVLTIAATIMLVVFLAVPALQRSQRNTQRKANIQAVGAAVSEFVANNQGLLPTASSGSANPYSLCNTACDSATKKVEFNQGYYTSAATFIALSSTGTTSQAAVTSDTYLIVTKGKCTTTASATYGSERSVAILYAIEGAGGTGGYVSQCQDV